MEKSTDLLNKALEIRNAANWQKALGLSNSAIYLARKRGRLSPTLAARFAIELQEDPIHWAGIAALEAEQDSENLDYVRSRIVKNHHY